MSLNEMLIEQIKGFEFCTDFVC